jgi:hypothetical protein
MIRVIGVSRFAPFGDVSNCWSSATCPGVGE